MTDKMLPQAALGAPVDTLVRCAVTWRGADRKAIADKRDHDAQRAEYRERKNLRQAVDVLEQKAGQP